MDYILAIDSGTTSTRVLAFDTMGRVECVEQIGLDTIFPQPGWVEQNPLEIWEKTNECLTTVLKTVGSNNVNSIGLTNQRETSIIWQRSTGKAIGPAINWQCRRTQLSCEKRSGFTQKIKEKTGLPLDPYFSASKFEWLLEHYPETKSLINQDDLCFGTVDVWLLFNLTKGETYATDVTNASRTMLFNIHNLKFDSDLCQLFNIPIHLLPEVKQSADHYGIVEFDDCPIPIKGVIGDQQAALYSQCGQDKGKIKNTYGTGCFIMANTGSQIVTTNQLVSTIAIGANNHVDYAIEGSIFTGGSLIQWLRDNLNIIDHVEESETLAKSIPSSDGVTLIPALTGLGAPYWRPEVTGTITGLTHKTTRAHLVRAALESIALQSHDIITIIRQELPTMSFDSLFVDGGASQNNWLMQLQADISKMTVVRAPDIEATALGAAMCAGLADNFFQFPSPSATTFESLVDQTELTNQWRSVMAGSID